jgi:hypothetical protein
MEATLASNFGAGSAILTLGWNLSQMAERDSAITRMLQTHSRF